MQHSHRYRPAFHSETADRFTGPLMMISTAVFFSTMALFVRLASISIPVGMIIFTRYVLSTALFAVLALTGILRIRPVNYRLLFCRSLAASLGGVCYFFAVSSISIAEAVILKYTYPLFAVSIAALLYGEKTDRLILLLLGGSIAGVIIMMSPSSLNIQTGYFWGLGNGMTAGAAVAFVRKLRATDDSATIMFFTSLMGIVVSAPFLPAFHSETADRAGGFVIPEGKWLVFVLGAAVCGIIAQFCIVYGMRFIKTGSASVIMMLEVVLSSLLGFLILGDVIGIPQYIGGALILFGGAVLIMREGQKNKQAALTKAEDISE